MRRPHLDLHLGSALAHQLAAHHDHTVAMWRSPDGRDDHLPLLSDGRRSPIRPQLVCADQQLLMQLAQIVGAIVYVPLPPQSFGGLKPVPEAEVGRTIELRCYVPHVLRAVPRIRALVDVIQAMALTG